MRLNLILWYHILKLPGKRRRHDALGTLLFGYNVRFHTTLTLFVDLCGSLPAVVRDSHPLNHKPCPSFSTCWGIIATIGRLLIEGNNKIPWNDNLEKLIKSHKLLQLGARLTHQRMRKRQWYKILGTSGISRETKK